MTLKKAIKILKYQNKWRTGRFDEIRYTPREITKAINKVLKKIRKK